MALRALVARGGDLGEHVGHERLATETGLHGHHEQQVEVRQVGRDGGELLFNLIAHRYERRSLIVTTNLPFAEWPKVFGDDEKLTTALLDRLADRATVIVTKGKSFRMRRRQAQPANPEPEEPDTTKPKKR